MHWLIDWHEKMKQKTRVTMMMVDDDVSWEVAMEMKWWIDGIGSDQITLVFLFFNSYGSCSCLFLFPFLLTSFVQYIWNDFWLFCMYRDMMFFFLGSGFIHFFSFFKIYGSTHGVSFCMESINNVCMLLSSIPSWLRLWLRPEIAFANWTQNIT